MSYYNELVQNLAQRDLIQQQAISKITGIIDFEYTDRLSIYWEIKEL